MLTRRISYPVILVTSFSVHYSTVADIRRIWMRNDHFSLVFNKEAVSHLRIACEWSGSQLAGRVREMTGPVT
jgi:hypothetical protein